MARKHHQTCRLLGDEVHITMTCWVLRVSNGTGEKRHFPLTFCHNAMHVAEWSVLWVERFPHQGHTNKIMRISRTFVVGRFSDRDFDFLKSLKHGNVVITPEKLRPDLLRKGRL